MPSCSARLRRQLTPPWRTPASRAQVAGQLQLAGAVHDVGLHLQQLAAHLGPGKAVDHADLVGLAACILAVWAAAQKVLQLLAVMVTALHPSAPGAWRLAAQLAQLPLQRPHAGLPGIVGDNGRRASSSSRSCPCAGRAPSSAWAAGGSWRSAAFPRRCSCQLDDLHAVQQRPGNGDVVLAVVMNITWLRSTGTSRKWSRKAPFCSLSSTSSSAEAGSPRIVAGQLVDLVQQQQRIHGARSADGLDDAAGHGADIGFPVAPDVRLVTHAAQD